MHALLLVVIFVAPAFLPERPSPPPPVMRMIDARLLDRLESRPASAAVVPTPTPAPAPAPVVVPVEPPPAPAPKVSPPQPVQPPPPPPAPKPAPKPIEPPKREPVKETPKPAKVEPKVLVPSPKGKEAPTKKDSRKTNEPEPPKASATKPAPAKEAPSKSTIKIADIRNLVSHKAEEDAKAKQRAEAEERAQAVAKAKAALAAHQQRVAKMNSILGGISGGLSSPVDINIDAGSGPNAVAFLEYGQMMVQVYERSWLLPGTLSDSTAVVSVTVTVARNGRVLNWDIRKGSGNSAIDKSVRETLQKVTQFEPFPASFREQQRTFNIDFNLKAKRTTG